MRFSMAHLGAGAAIAPTVLILAGLAGCNGGSGDGRLALTGAAYCTPFQKTSNPSSSSQSGLGAQPAPDPAAAFDDCLHRWAYAMAPARDPADIVAHAAVDACGAAMNAWNQQAMAQSPNGQYSQEQYQDQGPPNEGRQSQQDMQQQMQEAQNSPIGQHMQIAQARSLFYVIQARAAGCAPPPASTLVSNPAAGSPAAAAG